MTAPAYMADSGVNAIPKLDGRCPSMHPYPPCTPPYTSTHLARLGGRLKRAVDVFLAPAKGRSQFGSALPSISAQLPPPSGHTPRADFPTSFLPWLRLRWVVG